MRTTPKEGKKVTTEVLEGPVILGRGDLQGEEKVNHEPKGKH